MGKKQVYEHNVIYDNFLSGTVKAQFLFNAINSMFMYDIEGIENVEIEKRTNKYGISGFVRIDDELTVVEGSRCGDLDRYGYGKSFSWVTGDGLSGESVIGKDCVIMYNNDMHFSEIPLIKYFVEKLNEADITENSTLVLARLMPLFVVKDSNGKHRIDEILENLKNGELKSVVSDDILEDLRTNGKSKGLDVVNITDINNIDKLQYVVKFYDDIIKRMGLVYGLPLNTTAKMAQLTTKETEGWEALSQVYPLNKLNCRRRAMKDLEKVFGIKASVRFSEVWEHCENVMLNTNVETDKVEENETVNDEVEEGKEEGEV